MQSLVLINLILFGSLAAQWASTLAVGAEPLQGFAERSDTPTRIQRPTNDAPSPVIQGNVDQDLVLQHPALVNTAEFSRQTPRIPLPANNQQILGNTTGGQNEYWVSWDVWRHRIADAVWGPLKARRTIMWGMTRVDYDVTSDRHIQISSVRTPDPTGKSGKILAAAIMQLENSPILEFPTGSKQTIHHNYNMETGLPMPGRTRYTLYLPGGNEHVMNQW